MPDITISSAQRRSSRTIRLITLQFLASLLGISFLSWYAVGVQRQALGALERQAAHLETRSHHRTVFSKIVHQSLEYAYVEATQTTSESERMQAGLRASLGRLKDLSAAWPISTGESPGLMESPQVIAQYEDSISTTTRLVNELLATPDPSKRLPLAQEISHVADQSIHFHGLVLDELMDKVAISSELVALIGLRAGMGVTFISVLIVLGVVLPTSRKLSRALSESVEIARERESANNELAAAQDSLRIKNETLADQQSQLQESLEFAEHQTYLNRVASMRFQSLFQGLPVGCMTFDHDGQIIEWNEKMSSLFEVETAQVLYRSLDDVFSTIHDPRQFRRLIKLVSNGEEYPETDWEIVLPRGDQRVVRVAAFPLRSLDGALQGGIANVLDVTEQRRIEREIKEANRQLAALASQDGLTGLMNHITLQKSLEVAFSSGRPMAFVLLDVDYFKLYNDSFGHPAGDEVLRVVASILTTLVPENDIAARYGGEEFAIAFFESDRATVIELTEKIRSEFEQIEWPNRPVTASFGVAFSGPESKSHRDLIEAADRALYQSKADGRNRVSVAGDTAKAA